MLNIRSMDWIAAELGWGAKLHETAWGPKALAHYLQLTYKTTILATTLYVPQQSLNYSQRLHEIIAFSSQLAQATQQSIEENRFPIVIGGDHAMAIGTWSGIISALQAKRKFGLIWIDAHMDSHTPETTPSMAIHGMPLAVLLGHGEKALVELGGQSPKLDPQHVVLIGVRSFEEGEAALLKKLNVKIYYMSEVKQRGLPIVLKEAIEIVSKDTKGFGVSIDLDAFDPSLAPGVGSPEKDGIDDLNDLQEAFKFLSQAQGLKAIEIAEYNPSRDSEHKTAELVKLILGKFQSKEVNPHG